ncbi:very short patch repair endonuclease [Chryseobacterium gambrini]|uniref:very short patch repair endonuclease n=1 Tax=Chryseobacterium gambrini TaxID=373672 RepID=UPI0022F19EB7|nr:very short patch repair endonuclease [Chryseobacterium gambrini]WBV52839.1 very short patch repair endonuclease [Chryseobacterium gambrini]
MTKFNFNTTAERSKNMSKIRSKNTQPEILLRKALWSEGIRYRLNLAKLPGKPDIVINKFKLAIFVDGSFWHGYKWDEKKIKIKSNKEYWLNKIERNIERDNENNIALQKAGYTVLRFWDHQVKKDISTCISIIKNFIEKF